TPTPPAPTPTPTPTPDPDTDIRVAIAGPSAVANGQPDTFSVSVINDGPNTSPGATLDLDLTGGTLGSLPGCSLTSATTATCDIGSQPNLSSVDVQVPFLVTANNSLSLTATVTGQAPDPDLTNNVATETVPVLPFADLSIAIDDPTGDVNADGEALPGGAITIPVVIDNLGPDRPITTGVATITITGATVTGVGPGGGGGLAGCTLDGNTLTCPLEALVNASRIILVNVIVTDLDQVTVDVSVTADIIDPVSANNTDSRVIPVAQIADVAVDIEPVGDLVRNGSGIIAVAVRNDGPSPASGVAMTLSTVGATVVPTTHDDPRCSVAAGALSCDIGGLIGGESTTIYASLAIGDVANVTSTATVTSDTTVAEDPDTTNNTDVTGPTNPPFDTVDGGPEPVFGLELTGDATTVGNTLLSCGADDANPIDANGLPDPGFTCDQIRSSREVLVGDFNYSANNRWDMRFVDADGVDLPAGMAENSSGADLVLPAGAQVEFAALTWSASTDRSVASPTVKFGSGPIGFVPTSIDEYIDVTASNVRSSNGAYQGYADVTSVVSSSGTYWLAGVDGAEAMNEYAGWSLTVVWSGGTESHNIVLFDGFEMVDAGTSLSIDVGGFATPATGVIDIGMTVNEGDLGFVDDQFAVTTIDADGNETGGGAYSDAVNPADDPFNSTLSWRGQLLSGGGDTTHVPSYANTLGLDIDTFQVSAPSATAGRLDFTTTFDSYFVGSFVIIGSR
ncbi:MAG: DUF11 domain-containing protein, partial [Acidimicrobiia bacterium]|nr:DUF11 domain-containing protein [Acidimicrobiia bacterium]